MGLNCFDDMLYVQTLSRVNSNHASRFDMRVLPGMNISFKYDRTKRRFGLKSLTTHFFIPNMLRHAADKFS